MIFWFIFRSLSFMQMALVDLPPRLRRLHHLFTDPKNSIFLSRSVNELLRFTRNDPILRRLTRADIIQYQRSLSDISRDREVRILRNRRRHLSYRKWRTFAPGHILLADLCFMRPLSNPKHGKPIIILVMMDAFSRLLYTDILPSTKSIEVARRLDSAIQFYGSNYRLFCSDRG